MNPIVSFPRSFYVVARLVAGAALLLPLSAFADPQLSLSDNAQSGDCDSAIVDCHSYPYNNSQTSPAGTSLTDGASSSDVPWGLASFSADVFYGSFHADGSTSALESVGGNRLGSGSFTSSGSWTNAMTINSPGMDGQAATVRITLHASGDAAGSSSSNFGSSNASYSYSVGDGFNGTSFAGQWDTMNGWDSSGPPSRSFTFDANCTFGQPCEITTSASFSVSSSTGEPDFGDPQDASTNGSGSLTVNSGSVQVLDPNNDGAPVSYTMVSNVGSGAGQVTPAGASYGGFTVTNSAQGSLGSTFSLLDGTASQNTNVTANFVAPLPIKAASDVVDLKGTDGDLQVVQTSYDPAKQAFLGPLVYLQFCFLSAAHGTRWVSATLGNYNGPPPTPKSGPYDPATDFHLGYFGIDTTNHVAWAVINHNSLFAAAIPFDLVSVVSRKTHGSAGTYDVALPLTGGGVEPRSGGANGDHTLVFTFKSNLASGDVSIASGAGTISGTPTMSGNIMTVNLTNVPNGQVTTLSLHNMTDVASQVLDDTTISVGFLVGDANGDRVVNAADATFTRNHSGEAASALNFRADYNVDGTVNAADSTVTRNHSGNGLSAPVKPAAIRSTR